MRYFTLLVCFLTACLAFLFVYRTTITEKIITDRLQAVGAKDIQVKVNGFNSHTLSIASLSATFPNNSPLQSAQLHDLTLHYDLSELLDGTVAELDIDAVHIRLNKQKRKTANNASDKDIRSYLPQKISVHNLLVPVPEINGDLTLQFSVLNNRGKPLDIELGITAKEISQPGWELAALRGKFFLQTDGTIISLQKNSHIEIHDLQGAAASLQEVHFQLSGILTKSPDKGWLTGPATIIATPKGLQLQELLIQPSSLSLHIAEQASLSPALQFHSFLDTSDLLFQWKDKSIALQDIQIDFEADKHTLQLSALFAHPLVPGQVEVRASHNLIQNTGEAHLTTPFPFTLSKSSQLVTGLQLPFLLSNGLMNCNGYIQWEAGKPLLANAGFEINDAAGEYKDITFSGLHIQQDVQLFPEIYTVQPGTVFLNEMHNGLTVSNIELHNQIIHHADATLPTLLIDSVQAEILGGKVSSKDIIFDPVQQDLELLVQLHGIALDKVINLNKLKGLSVTGIVDGNILIQRKNQQFSIPDGELHSREPGGTIRYLPPGGTAGLSQLPAYAMKALQEFNYDTLVVTPRYESDGMLTVAIHTEGHSPPLNTTRPVHLNLNTEQNLLSLLQSLRYSKNLTDDLEQNIQTQQLKN
jgi:Dicarboxylate transport